MKVKYSVGIDPGWRSCGLAVVKEDEKGISLLHCETLDPKELGGIAKAAHSIALTINNCLLDDGATPGDLSNVTIERYVSYNNILTGESENIVMLIGALVFAFSSMYPGASLQLYRAIEWKSSLVKLLVKNKGFDNPSTSLDKKFSIAAAHACLDIEGQFNTDHEADSIALSSIGLLESRYTKTKKVG